MRLLRRGTRKDIYYRDDSNNPAKAAEAKRLNVEGGESSDPEVIIRASLDGGNSFANAVGWADFAEQTLSSKKSAPSV